MTLTQPNPFAETGAASSFKRQIENYSNGLTDLPGVTHLGEITPFQRQVLDAAVAEENRRQEERQQEMKGQTSPARPTNPRAGGVGPKSGPQSQFGQHETVRYINKNENPDHPVHNREPDDLTDE